MSYSPDISGFPYWKVGGPYATAVKVERKSWDKVAKDLMRLSGQKVSLEREKKSLKGECLHLSNKVKKLKEKFQEDWETGTEKIAQQLSEALEANKRIKKVHSDNVDYWRKQIDKANGENKVIKDQLKHQENITMEYEKEWREGGRKIYDLELALDTANERLEQAEAEN